MVIKTQKTIIYKVFAAAFVMTGIILVGSRNTYANSVSPSDFPGLTVDCNEGHNHGTVSISGNANDRYTITATPDPGYVFKKWTISGSDTMEVADIHSPSTTIFALTSGVIHANFVRISTTITPSDGAGSVSYSSTGGVGSTLTFTATPNSGYVFDHWEVGGSSVGTNSTYSDYVPDLSLYSITAVFAQAHTVTFTVVNGKWDDNLTTNKTVPVANEGSLTLAQIPGVGNKPNGGYKVGSWSSPAPDPTTQITGNVTYTYTYAVDTHEYPINRDQRGQGRFDVRVSNRSVTSARYNTTITLMAYPDPGWSFSGWESPDVVIDNPTSTSLATFLMPQEGVMLTAVFTQNPVTNHTVTYHVVNGKWNDTNTSGDRTETVANGQHPAHVPPVGSEPNAGYKAGSWNTNPSSATITGNTTFTYTYATNTSPSSSSKKSDDSDHHEESSSPEKPSWTPAKAAATIAAQKAQKQQAAALQLASIQTMLRTKTSDRAGTGRNVIDLDMTKVDILDPATVNLLLLNNRFAFNVKISVPGGLTTTIMIPANFNFRPFIKADGTMNIHEVLWWIISKRR